MATNDRERKRVQLDFTPAAYERLRRIRVAAEAQTNAEVVRDALRLYEWLIEEVKIKKVTLQITGEDGKTKEVRLLF
jgi:hypothetical protein